MFNREISLSELPGPLAEALEYWRGLGGEDLACKWSDFKLHQLPPEVVPTTMVIDLYDDAGRNRYRFWGSRMTDIHGHDMTGQSPYEISPPELGPVLRDQHELLRARKTADAQVFGFTHAKGYTHVHTVMRMPLSDDGRSITQIVVIVLLSEEAWKFVEEEESGALPRLWAEAIDQWAC